MCTREVIRMLVGLDVRSSQLMWVCIDCNAFWDLTGQRVEEIGRRLWREPTP